MQKAVLLPIIVPRGDFCWSSDGGDETCRHFDNAGGHERCELNLGSQKRSNNGSCLKAPECAALLSPGE